MKKIVLFILVFCSLTSLYSQQFYSLDGIEDEQGNTILLYRFGQNQYEYNPVYKLNTSNLEESLLIQAFVSTFKGVEHFKLVFDFEFFPDDVNNFMNVGIEYDSVNLSYIARNDSIVFSSSEFFERVDISKQDPQKVFVLCNYGTGALIRSWDRGYTFPLDSIQTFTNFIPIASADFDENVLFGFNHDILFCKNGSVVDASYVGVNQYFKMLYDVNQTNIYRVYYNGYNWSLKVSNNKGDANTWTATY